MVRGVSIQVFIMNHLESCLVVVYHLFARYLIIVGELKGACEEILKLPFSDYLLPSYHIKKHS